jgi:hypothetical protein
LIGIETAKMAKISFKESMSNRRLFDFDAESEEEN